MQGVMEATSDQARWDLPQGWKWRRAKEFAKIIGGGTPKNASDPSNFSENGTPWVTPADLTGYTKATISEGRRSLSEVGLSSSSARALPKGAVLISSRAPVGYCAIAAGEITTNQGFRSLVCDESIDPFFIRYYVLLSRQYLEANASGTTFKELSGTALSNLLFPVPPIDTQRRIVARIDELFSELDDGEDELARAHTDLENYRKALLKAAVTGELTADWRDDAEAADSGTDLLGTILSDRRIRWEADPSNRGKRYAEPVPPGTQDLPSLPDGWTWAAFGQVIDRLRNGISIKPANTPPGIPILRISSVRAMSVNASDHRWLPTDFEVGDAFAQFGDLLFTRYNGNPELVGVCGRYRSRTPVAYPDKVMCAPPSAVLPALADYLEMAMNAGAARKFVQAYTKTSAGQHGVSGDTVKRTPVPLPPAKEIEKIVTLYQSASALAEEGWRQATDLRSGSTTLRQSILSAAFRGELVQ